MRPLTTLYGPTPPRQQIVIGVEIGKSQQEEATAARQQESNLIIFISFHRHYLHSAHRWYTQPKRDNQNVVP